MANLTVNLADFQAMQARYAALKSDVDAAAIKAAEVDNMLLTLLNGGQITNWSPADIGASLEWWIDMSTGTTVVDGKLTGAADQSGKGRDVSPLNVANPPYYDAAAIGGKPGIYFEVTPDRRLVTAEGQTGLSGLTARTTMLVVKSSNYSQGAAVSEKTGDAYGFTLDEPYGDDTYFYLSGSYYLARTLDVVNPHIWIQVYDAALAAESRHKLYLNGSLIATGAGPANLGSLTAIQIGGRGNAFITSPDLNTARFSEIVMCSSAVDDTTRGNLFTYAGDKYSVALA